MRDGTRTSSIARLNDHDSRATLDCHELMKTEGVQLGLANIGTFKQRTKKKQKNNGAVLSTMRSRTDFSGCRLCELLCRAVAGSICPAYQ